MKTNKTNVAGCCAVALLVVLASAPAGASTEGASNNFFGTGAGASNSGYQRQLIFRGLRGVFQPQHHRLLQHLPREYCRLLQHHRLLQHLPREVCRLLQHHRQRNVFIGSDAGLNETGSNKLYIDNCLNGSCDSPFIYGEFDNHLFNINGEVGIAANGASKSQLHFSLDGSDVGGWLTAVTGQQLLCLLRGGL